MKQKKSGSAFSGTKINPTAFHPSQIKFYVILAPISIFMVMPIIYILSSAFKPLNELFAFPPSFFVRQPTFANFKYLFETGSSGIPKARYIFNSLTVSLIVVAGNIVVSAMAGYALSKKNFKTKRIISEINTLALMFVSTAVMIPRFLIISKTGIIDTYFALILPELAMPVGLFLIKQFIDQIPDSLIEAANMDGANDLTVFFRIIIPMIAPAMATVAILAFQATWNSADSSDYYVNNESMRTFAFYIKSLSSSGNVVAGMGMSAAAAMIMFLPNMLIFIFMQSKVMSTMAHSGIK